jgi:SAM-dependent methyltransferase
LTLADPITYSVRRQRLDRDLESAAGALTGDVLEIGCGHAGRRGRFRPNLDGVRRWIYLDRDPARVPDICGDGLQLPLRPAAFDAVVCLEVLEYVWQPALALAEINRVLKPGGTLVLSTPLLHRVDAVDDYWRFTEPALRRMLREAGFDVIRLLAQGSALAVAASALRSVVSVQGTGVRRVLSIALRPFFAALLGADASSARRRPVLATFTTGYLVVARSAALEHA